ncbi:hypothetical protein SDRG_15554 [Saprolegnia diclina VS20]|uniref:ATP synthase mitochondrial F1 complex assembly factor 1 n=1 Tax=Saprolegnia diclina (strain VS20) TaxID=1156394 RepID=T0PMI6_SAPDV|nr:hypothetical protein SDRG_15554 [Saprolegnia diclina VS20]EQC26614.1 hypothetical protein SDRG_15554 [Saprolegnia diclina VS20]|eukprot:XP_008619952.1 hypothetical protein SDRG_15554 [Saprolegnia diclina VS20]
MVFMLRRAFSTSKGGGFSFPSPRSLQSIVKLETLSQEAPDAIRRIWTEFHADKSDSVASALSKTDFELLTGRAKDCPFFVLPVYRVNSETNEEGYFTMLSQFQDKCFLITTLDAYRENPSQAPPCLTISLFDDLLTTKELALLRGDVANVLDKPEATTLFEALTKRYIDDAHFDMVHAFNKRPQEFNFDAYLAECKALHKKTKA